MKIASLNIITLVSSIVLYSCIGSRAKVVSNQNDSQNYPNPFSPSTEINFTTKTAQPVLITLFDIKGNPMDTIFNGISLVGYNKFIPKMDTLPSGVYLYRFISKDTSYTKKLMLLK
jgi:hypothetical protein